MRLWNINFLPEQPETSLNDGNALISQQPSSVRCKPGHADIIDTLLKTGAGEADEIMTVDGLINVFSRAQEHALQLKGPYGYINMIPEQHKNSPDTYHVDCFYKTSDQHMQVQHADGFRLSTACCLSACVMFGEKQVNGAMIDLINTQLN